jgi:hypothetical protein
MRTIIRKSQQIVFFTWTLLGLMFPLTCQAQQTFELSCQSGSVPLLSPTYNFSTQQFRAWVCVDPFGTVSSPVFGNIGAYGLLSVLTGVTYASFFVGNAGSGDITLYTVPSGFRALIQTQDFNTAGSTTTYFPEIKIGGAGSFYHVSGTSTTATLNENNFNLGMVLEPGDVFAYNTSQAGLNISGTVILFSTNSPLKTKRFYTGWVNGNNTVYTCKSTALIAGFSPFFNSSTGASVSYVNQSGSSATISWNLVKNGNSVGSTNEIANNNNAAVTNNSSAGGTSNYYMAAGDFISINTNQTGQQIAWVNVFEGI